MLQMMFAVPALAKATPVMSALAKATPVIIGSIPVGIQCISSISDMKYNRIGRNSYLSKRDQADLCLSMSNSAISSIFDVGVNLINNDINYRYYKKQREYETRSSIPESIEVKSE